MHVAAFNSLIEVILFAIIVQNYMYIDLPAQSISVYMKTHTASFLYNRLQRLLHH